MAEEFRLPDLGEGIHEAEILKVKTSEGQVVEEDEPILEVETDKAVVEIPSPFAGVVNKVHVKDGQVVTVGSVLISFTRASESKTGLPSAKTGTSPAKRSATKAAAGQAPINEDKKPTAQQAIHNHQLGEHSVADTEGRPVPAAPSVRRLARQLGVDLSLCTATGGGGRVLEEDVLNFANRGKTAGATSPVMMTSNIVVSVQPADLPDFSKFGPVERAPLKSVRRKIAENMSLAWAHIPAVAHFDQCDVTELETFRKAHNDSRDNKYGGNLTLTVFALKAIVSALARFPQFNASLDERSSEIIYKRYYNVGVAVATERGLIVPVVRDVDKKSLLELSEELAETVRKTREGKIELEQLHGGTFTLTNPGPMGGTGMVPLINYPEVAIMGMARADLKPVVRNNEVQIRRILPLTLCFDHRVTDGAEAAHFTNHVIAYLEQAPEELSR